MSEADTRKFYGISIDCHRKCGTFECSPAECLNQSIPECEPCNGDTDIYRRIAEKLPSIRRNRQNTIQLFDGCSICPMQRLAECIRNSFRPFAFIPPDRCRIERLPSAICGYSRWNYFVIVCKNYIFGGFFGIDKSLRYKLWLGNQRSVSSIADIAIFVVRSCQCKASQNDSSCTQRLQWCIRWKFSE